MAGWSSVIPSPRFISAPLGQYDYDAVPAIPPEIVLFPELVLLQYLRDFFVVAGDPGSAVDSLCEEAVQEDCPGAGNR